MGSRAGQVVMLIPLVGGGAGRVFRSADALVVCNDPPLLIETVLAGPAEEE
jgi:hypothetical protein